jgi:hypothetical protein
MYISFYVHNNVAFSIYVQHRLLFTLLLCIATLNTAYFGLTEHLQEYMFVSQCRPYKATVTTMGSLSLGWYYYAAIHVISFMGFVASNFPMFQCVAVLDLFVCCIRYTLLVHRNVIRPRSHWSKPVTVISLYTRIHLKENKCKALFF